MLWTRRPVLDVDFGLPTQERYSRLSETAVNRGRSLLDAISAMIPPTAHPLADGVRVRTVGRFHGDACALAQAHGVNWRDVILANVSYDLYLASLGCSTLALPGPDGPVLARNMDWSPEALLAQASFQIRHVRDGKCELIHAGWPASIGCVTGLSPRGFAVALNAVSSPEGLNMSGYPVLLFLRTLLEDARDFSDAFKRICSQKLAMSGLITLVGTRNEERVVIERSPVQHAPRWGEPGKPLMTTNHYRKLYVDELDANYGECSRFDRLRDLLDGNDTQHVRLSDDKLLAILSDPGVIQQITAQHIIARPAENTLEVYVPSRLVS